MVVVVVVGAPVVVLVIMSVAHEFGDMFRMEGSNEINYNIN
jgi:hypothetical protein